MNNCSWLPEDLVLCPPWMDHQQNDSQHVPLLSLQTHHIHAHVQMYEIQHSSIVPADWTKSRSIKWILTSLRQIIVSEQSYGQTWLKNKAKCASSTALSTSASSHTMKGDFPPSSKVTGFRLLFAANWRTTFPVAVDPVKASCTEITESLGDIQAIKQQSVYTIWEYVSWIVSIPPNHFKIWWNNK